MYRILLRQHGHAAWWPGETPFEICLGAILTQNTSWSNVEKALANLRARGLLSFEALAALEPSQLAKHLRPSGYFNVKARRVRSFLVFLGREYGGRAESMAREDRWALRAKLLSVNGIGPETADSIVLYAAGLPLFVVDAYTRRIFSRLGLLRGDEGYAQVQRFFMERLPADAALYNDYHAQIVLLGKATCRARPRCAACPLTGRCPKRGVVSALAARGGAAGPGTPSGRPARHRAGPPGRTKASRRGRAAPGTS